MDYQKHRAFMNWVLQKTEVDANFYKKLILNGGDHFYLNRQNCRIWSNKNSLPIQEEPVHLQKFVAWCVLCTGIIGLCFFQDEVGNAVTVGGIPYRKIYYSMESMI